MKIDVLSFKLALMRLSAPSSQFPSLSSQLSALNSQHSATETQVSGMVLLRYHWREPTQTKRVEGRRPTDSQPWGQRMGSNTSLLSAGASLRFMEAWNFRRRGKHQGTWTSRRFVAHLRMLYIHFHLYFNHLNSLGSEILLFHYWLIIQ